MNIATTVSAETKILPINVLEKLFSSRSSGCLQVLNNSITWSIFLKNGEVIYASHSVDPFDRLERHLRCLSQQAKTLTSDVRTQVRLKFETEIREQPNRNFDYQAICWLVRQQYLNSTQAATLVERLIEEVLELFLLLKDGTCAFYPGLNELPKFCQFDSRSLVDSCKKRLQDWQALSPEIRSPYQIPYLISQTQKLPSEQKNKLSTVLQGFSFRHLAAIFDQDALKVAQTLHPLIVEGTIGLREPEFPFNLLPSFHSNHLGLVNQASAYVSTNSVRNITLDDIPTVYRERKYTIACVDDSATILNEIDRFLENRNFSVFTITDSVKALVEIIRIKPDLILLDVGMPTVDGYKLCRLIRNHSLFKSTPIIMVTGNTGLIDRAKAKLTGATEYMTKPFTQSELLKMVFRYLT